MANEAITVTESESPRTRPGLRRRGIMSLSPSPSLSPELAASGCRPGHNDPSRYLRLWQPVRQPGGGPAPSQAQCGPVESTEWTRKATDRRSRHGHSA